MEFRFWIGIWTFLLLFLMTIFNLSFLVKYITRFTEDCFATLVAVVFIIDAITSMINLKKIKNPKSKNLNLNNYKVEQNESLDLYNSNNFSLNVWSSTIENKENDLKNSQLFTTEHNLTFFFSLLIFIFTFLTCVELKHLKNTPYFPSKVIRFSVIQVLIFHFNKL